METSPFIAPVWFHVGPLAITRPVVTTWAIMVVLSLGASLATRHLALRADRTQTATEALVATIEAQLAETMQTDARPFLPLLGTLFIFVLVANLSGLLPGVVAPTGSFETDAALALTVFVFAQVYGLGRRGLRPYLAGFAKPNIVMLPLNLLGEVTRIFSLMVRLFGNIMSGHFVIAIVLSLAGLFVPLPLMALEVIVGIVQAYIFTILSAVLIGAAVGTIERG